MTQVWVHNYKPPPCVRCADLSRTSALNRVMLRKMGQQILDDRARRRSLDRLRREVLAIRDTERRFTARQVIWVSAVSMVAGMYAGLWIMLTLLAQAVS